MPVSTQVGAIIGRSDIRTDAASCMALPETWRGRPRRFCRRHPISSSSGCLLLCLPVISCAWWRFCGQSDVGGWTPVGFVAADATPSSSPFPENQPSESTA